MNISEIQTDSAVLEEFGRRIEQQRLNLQLTQAQLAEQAGVSKRTLERIESGASAQLSSIVRIFRVLGLLPVLDQLLGPPEPRPLDLLKRRGKPRQRASGQRCDDAVAEEPWRWDDDA